MVCAEGFDMATLAVTGMVMNEDTYVTDSTPVKITGYLERIIFTFYNTSLTNDIEANVKLEAYHNASGVTRTLYTSTDVSNTVDVLPVYPVYATNGLLNGIEFYDKVPLHEETLILYGSGVSKTNPVLQVKGYAIYSSER